MDTENNRFFLLKNRIVAFLNLIYDFSFVGKFSRKEWWTYFLLSIVLNLHVIIWAFLFAGALLFVIFTFGMGYSILSDIPATPNDILRPFLGQFTYIISQLLFFTGCYLYFTSTTKRFHDRNKGWEWSLMVFVPVVGIWWVLIECGFLKGINDSPSLDSDNKINENKLINYGGNLFLLLCIFLITIFYFNIFSTHKNSIENSIRYVYVDGKKVPASEFTQTNDHRYFIRNDKVYLRSCLDCAISEYILMPGMSTTSFQVFIPIQQEGKKVSDNQNEITEGSNSIVQSFLVKKCVNSLHEKDITSFKYWADILTNLYPNFFVDKNGVAHYAYPQAYCEFDNGTKLVSFVPDPDASDDKGQVVILFDKNNKIIKKTKNLHQQTLGEITAPDFGDIKDGEIILLFKSGDAGMRSVQNYKLNLSDFTFIKI